MTSAELPCHTSALFFKKALLSTVNGETHFNHKQNLMYFYDVGGGGEGIKKCGCVYVEVRFYSEVVCYIFILKCPN